MNRMIAIKKVALNERHQRPGNTKHFLVGSQGKPDFPPFTSPRLLNIMAIPAITSCIFAKMVKARILGANFSMMLFIRLNLSSEFNRKNGPRQTSPSDSHREAYVSMSAFCSLLSIAKGRPRGFARVAVTV
jgi:hypothetical protein